MTLLTTDLSKRRRTSECQTEQEQQQQAEMMSKLDDQQQVNRTSLPFTRSMAASNCLGQEQLAELARLEAQLVAADRGKACSIIFVSVAEPKLF